MTPSQEAVERVINDFKSKTTIHDQSGVSWEISLRDILSQELQKAEERVLNELWLRLNTKHKKCVAIKNEGALGVMHMPLDCIQGEIESLKKGTNDTQ